MKKDRSCEYDMVRTVLMLLLPLIHVVEYWGYVCGGADLIVRSDVDMIEPIERFALYYTAPCFMIMMGINMLFTHHDTPKDFLRRGVTLLCVEMVFNLIRYMLPACIGFAISEYKSDVMDYAVFGLFNSDILAFAGLAFIVMAGLKKLRMSSRGVILTAFVMWLAGILFTHFVAPWTNEHCSAQVTNILGSLVWINSDSNFPLVNWMIYPAIGYFFMDNLRKTSTDEAKERIWRCCGIGGLLIMGIEILATRYYGKPMYETLSVNGSHHFLTPWVVLFSTGATFSMMHVCHLLAPLMHRNSRLESIVTTLGSRLTSFYLIQWTIIGWGLFLTGGTNLWGCQQLTLCPTIIAIIIITLLSLIPLRFRVKR